MCLMGRTLPCKQLKESKEGNDEEKKKLKEISTTECPQTRVDFYHTLSLLIRMGVGKEEKERNPRRGVSIMYYLIN